MDSERYLPTKIELVEIKNIMDLPIGVFGQATFIFTFENRPEDRIEFLREAPDEE